MREGGAGLSAGERQLISIARALLADPRILILDEATSNIDRPTEILIEQALDRLLRGRTSIIIAHRLATVRRADEILVVEHGRITAARDVRRADRVDGAVPRASDMQVQGSATGRRIADLQAAASPVNGNRASSSASVASSELRVARDEQLVDAAKVRRRGHLQLRMARRR